MVGLILVALDGCIAIKGTIELVSGSYQSNFKSLSGHTVIWNHRPDPSQNYKNKNSNSPVSWQRPMPQNSLLMKSLAHSSKAPLAGGCMFCCTNYWEQVKVVNSGTEHQKIPGSICGTQ